MPKQTTCISILAESEIPFVFDGRFEKTIEILLGKTSILNHKIHRRCVEVKLNEFVSASLIEWKRKAIAGR